MPATLDSTILADRLVSKVDSIRGRVHGRLGTRPHVVELVTRTWTGPRLGEGTATDTRVVITPAPRVRPLIEDKLRPAGLEEEGPLVLTQVSLTYSETDLYCPSLTAKQEFFYRITGAHGQGQRARYYVAKKPPMARRGDNPGDDLDWRIELHRVERRDLPPLPEPPGGEE